MYTLYKKYLEELSELSRTFDAGLLQSQKADMAPLSFFSESYDILAKMNALLQSVEKLHVEKLQEQLEAHEDFETVQMVQAPAFIPEEKQQEEVLLPREMQEQEQQEQQKEQEVRMEEVVSEKAGELRHWKIALSDKFLFLKELFAGDKDKMDEVLKELESFSTLAEATAYLDKRFGWNWEKDAPFVFKTLLKSFYD